MRRLHRLATCVAACLAAGALVAAAGPSANADAPVDRPDSVERVSADHRFTARDLPPFEKARPGEFNEPIEPHVDLPVYSGGDPAEVVTIDDVMGPRAGGTTAVQLGSSPGIANTGWYPPDPQLAVGPGAIVEMVNGGGAIFNKIGNQTSTFTLAGFFGAPAISMTNVNYVDPRVYYDDLSDRFFAVIMAYDACSCTTRGNTDLRLAVSATTDPNGAWTVYSVHRTTNQLLLDQPKLGVSNDKVVLTHNDFAGASSFTGVGYTIVEKFDLLNGLSPIVATYNPNADLYQVIPVRSLSSTDTEYMVQTAGSTLTLFSVTGTPGTTLGITTSALPIAPVNLAPAPQQPNTPTTLEVGSSRAESAVWRNGALYSVGTSGCTPAGDTQQRACLRVHRVSTSGTALVTLDVDVASHGQYLFYPAVVTTPSGDLYATFTASSTSRFPSAAVLYAQGGNVTTTAPVFYYASGVGPYDVMQARNRWGDYSEIAIDPSHPDDVWAVNEYGSTSTTSTTQWATQLGWFTASAPSVTSVSPTSGPTSGGTLVEIRGHDFTTGSTTVSFGGTAATSVQWFNPNLIRAYSPSRPAGTVDIRVTTPLGTSPVTSADQFTYVAPPAAPVVTSLSPSGGPTYGGTSVAISGSGFSGATSVTFGGTPAASFAVNSDGSITAMAPSRPAGGAHVQVTTPTGTSTTSSASLYTYGNPPAVTSVTPPAGPTTGGLSVTIAGTGFTGVQAVFFGTAPAAFTVVSPTQIVATSPSVPVTAAGLVDVRVVTSSGTSGVHNNAKYLYV